MSKDFRRCAICGQPWGKHKAVDNNCPPDNMDTCSIIDRVWKETKYKPLSSNSEQA